MPSFSLLDFGTFYEPSSTSTSVINDLLSNINRYEELGYKRLWLGEHYDDATSWSTPEILIALLASRSSTIRVGIAGVLLKYHNTLHIAQTYRLLNSLFNDRIDLGLAKGNVPPHYLHALNKTTIPPDDNYYLEQVEELFNFLKNSHPKGHPDENITVEPRFAKSPDTWFLGASRTSVPLAIDFQSNFCFSLFHSHLPYAQMIEIPRMFGELYSQKNQSEAACAIAIKCYLSNNRDTLRKFQHIIDNSPWFNKAHALIGSAVEISDRILSYCHDFDVQEVVIVNEYLDLEDKIESSELLAENLIKK